MFGEPRNRFPLTVAALTTHGTQKRIPVSLVWIGALLWLCASDAPAQSPKRLSVSGLQELRLPEVKFDSVRAVRAHVEVRGRIGGKIGFELLLPDDWNGRFAMGGGGGFVGTIQNAARDSVRRGYATVGTDTGHQWQPGHMAGWAYTNLEAQLNFGHLAVHRTAEVAKALIRAYYGADPSFSYFLGCSRGGGQAMMESQRYPEDFDGIVAGAPAFDWTGLAASMISIAQTLYPDPNQLDKTVLDRAALEKLQKALLDQCDAGDGLKDGVIQDPSKASFDLGKVPDLTEPQRQALEAIYSGARNSRGRIAPGYAPPAECDPAQWMMWLVGPAPELVRRDRVPNLTFAFSTQIFKYLIFNDPNWDYSTYDFSNFESDTRLAASFLNATNPDLSSFKARKGRLILWHGWADPALPAAATVEYYDRVLALDSRAAEYCRLFLLPGCLHCGGGPGASEIDWLSVIRDWVEKGKAPDQLIAVKRENNKTVVTRPIYAYPRSARYKGSGDPGEAANFLPAQ